LFYQNGKRAKKSKVNRYSFSKRGGVDIEVCFSKEGRCYGV
jgi:hypothetical protein